MFLSRAYACRRQSSLSSDISFLSRVITLSHRAEDIVKWNEQMDRLRETAMTRNKRKKLEVRREEKQMEKATFQLEGGSKRGIKTERVEEKSRVKGQVLESKNI